MTFPIVILTVIIVILVYILYLTYDTMKSNNKYYKEKLEKVSKEAIAKSKAVIRGQVAEEIVPMFKNFPYTLSDLKFFGQPLDYIVFENMSAVRDGKEEEITIIFADVKSNTARNSKVQNAIKKAIVNKNIRFENWNIDLEGNLKIK